MLVLLTLLCLFIPIGRLVVYGLKNKTKLTNMHLSKHAGDVPASCCCLATAGGRWNLLLCYFGWFASCDFAHACCRRSALLTSPVLTLKKKKGKDEKRKLHRSYTDLCTTQTLPLMLRVLPGMKISFLFIQFSTRQFLTLPAWSVFHKGFCSLNKDRLVCLKVRSWSSEIYSRSKGVPDAADNGAEQNKSSH